MSKQGVVRIDGRVEWHSKFDTEGSQWLAVCPSLNLNAWGDTYEEMVECAHTVTRLLWDDLVEAGDFDEFLHERGWTAKEGYTSHGVKASKARVDVPYTMNPTDSSLVQLLA